MSLRLVSSVYICFIANSIVGRILCTSPPPVWAILVRQARYCMFHIGSLYDCCTEAAHRAANSLFHLLWKVYDILFLGSSSQPQVHPWSPYQETNIRARPKEPKFRLVRREHSWRQVQAEDALSAAGYTYLRVSRWSRRQHRDGDDVIYPCASLDGFYLQRREYPLPLYTVLMWSHDITERLRM